MVEHFSLNRAFVYRQSARARASVPRILVRVRIRPPLALSAVEQALLLGLLWLLRLRAESPRRIPLRAAHFG